MLSIKASEEEGDSLGLIVGDRGIGARCRTRPRVSRDPRAIFHEERPRVSKSMIGTIRGLVPAAEEKHSFCR